MDVLKMALVIVTPAVGKPLSFYIELVENRDILDRVRSETRYRFPSIWRSQEHPEPSFTVSPCTFKRAD